MKLKILNKKILVFLVATVSLLFQQCNDEDFLTIVPKSELTEGSYYKTANDAVEAITTCYDPMKHAAGMHDINMYYMFEAWSDYGVNESNTMNNFLIDANNTYSFFVYQKLYQGIYRCNLILEKIPEIEIDSVAPAGYSLKERLKGEAYFLRGLYHYYAMILFNQPPLMTETPKVIPAVLNNATQEQLRAQIKLDLEFAIENLPHKWEYSVNDYGRATKEAAYAVLGKMYMFLEEWALAKENFMALKNVEAENQLALMMPKGNLPNDYIFAYSCNFGSEDAEAMNFFVTPNGRYMTENNPESIFEVQFAKHIGWDVWEGGWQADGSLFTQYYGPDVYKNLVPTASLVNQYEATPDHPAGLAFDARRYGTIFEAGDTIYYTNGKAAKVWRRALNTNPLISQGYGWQKYFYPCHYDPSNIAHVDVNNRRIIRYADILLLLAEAEFHLNGSTALGLECINKVRSRAGVPDITEVTPAAIMHERDVELAFECARFLDLVRWSKLPTPWVDIEALLPGFKKGKNEYLPIPLSEIKVSGYTLKQNPGWS